MSEKEKKVGTVLWWHSGKMIGVAAVKNPDNSVDRFFLQLGKVIKGKESLAIGDKLRFSVSEKPVAEGRLPIAVAIEILSDEKGGQEGVL